jgi:hypothetical protein
MLHAPTTDRKNKAESTNSATLAEHEQENQKVNWSGRSPQSSTTSVERSPNIRDRSDLTTMQQAYGNQGTLRMLRAEKGRSSSTNPVQGGVLQRKCACGNAASATGTCAECQQKQGLSLQTKLRISEPGDRYEQEADRIADQVMRMPEPVVQRQMEPEEDEAEGMVQREIANRITPLVQRQVLPEMEGEEEEVIQTKAIDNQTAPSPTQESSEVPSSVHEVLRSPGQPLDPATRAFMEPRFGHDFSRVRVHSDAAAEQSAREVSAYAYTVGLDIAFGAGQYAPATLAGRWLLAHEFAHVVQQRHAAAKGPLVLGSPGDLAEQEAELAANRVMAGQQAALPRATENAEPVVRREPGPRTPTPPSPPEWLGPLRADATHLHGDLWDVQIRSLGRSPVGPHDQMQSYLRVFNQNRPSGVEAMQSAHIIGGEHIRDLGWDMPYNKAPSIGVASSLHDKWTREISNLQSQQGPMGGRTTSTVGRPIVGPEDVKALHHEVYRGIPELQEISQRIVNLEARRIMGAKYGLPKWQSPMDAHQGGIPKPTPKPMDAHQGGLPKPMPKPMDAHQGGLPKPTPKPMDAHKGGLPKPQSPMDAHQGGIPKPQSPMDAHQGGLPKPQSPMDAHQGGIPKPQSPMDAHQGGLLQPQPVPKRDSFLRARLNAAKGNFRAGIKGAFSAPSLVSMIPEVVLAVADKVAAREAIRAIQVKFVKEGFAKGVAAGVMWLTKEEVSSNLKNRVTPFRVKGMEDPGGILTLPYILQLAEAYENYGVDLGYQFSSSKWKKWKDVMRAKGLAALAKDGYYFGKDPQVFVEYNFIDKLAWELRFTTNPIVEEAIESGERQKEQQKEQQRQQRREDRGSVGNKV